MALFRSFWFIPRQGMKFYERFLSNSKKYKYKVYKYRPFYNGAFTPV